MRCAPAGSQKTPGHLKQGMGKQLIGADTVSGTSHCFTVPWCASHASVMLEDTTKGPGVTFAFCFCKSYISLLLLLQL